MGNRLKAKCVCCPLVADIEKLSNRITRLDETKGDFIHVVSHELRTPVALVKGYAEIIAACDKATSECQPVISGLSAAVARLEELVNLIVSAAQVSQGTLRIHPKPYSAKVLIRDVVAMWQATLAERSLTVELVFEVPEEDPLIWEIDTDYLEIALGHLLQNAIKFTPDDGVITLRLARPNGYQLRLEVIDTGIGIAASHREAIFEKFYRVGDSRLHSTGKTKFMGAGPGLGLYLVQGIVKAHQGQVWAEGNNDGPGSKFIICLPAARRANGTGRVIQKELGAIWT